MRGSKTGIGTTELLRVEYAVTGNLSKAAQAVGLPKQTAYDVLAREPLSAETHRDMAEAYVRKAWETVGEVDAKLKIKMSDPCWADQVSVKDLTQMQATLARTASLVAEAMFRFNQAILPEAVEFDTEENIEAAVFLWIGEKYGLTGEEAEHALGSLSN